MRSDYLLLCNEYNLLTMDRHAVLAIETSIVINVRKTHGSLLILLTARHRSDKSHSRSQATNLSTKWFLIYRKTRLDLIIQCQIKDFS